MPGHLKAILSALEVTVPRVIRVKKREPYDYVDSPKTAPHYVQSLYYETEPGVVIVLVKGGDTWYARDDNQYQELLDKKSASYLLKEMPLEVDGTTLPYPTGPEEMFLDWWRFEDSSDDDA